MGKGMGKGKGKSNELCKSSIFGYSDPARGLKEAAKVYSPGRFRPGLGL
jgi:hypothetical protein